MKFLNISLAEKEWKQIRTLKLKKGLTWRGVLINWYYNNK